MTAGSAAWKLTPSREEVMRPEVVAPLPTISGSMLPAPNPTRWLVDGVLPRDDSTIIVGQPGSFKSAYTAVLIAHLITKQPFLGLAVTQEPVKVLYIDTDGSWNTTGKLIHAAFRGVGSAGVPDDLHYYSPLMPECQSPGLPGFLPLENLGVHMTQAVALNGFTLVVFDSLTTGLEGDVNSSRDITAALRHGFDGVRALGATVVVLDHATKAARLAGHGGSTPLGSQAKRAWARHVITIEDRGGQGAGGSLWAVDKSNFRRFEPFATRLTFSEDQAGGLEEIRVERVETEAKRPPKLSALEKAMQEIMEKASEGPVRKGDFPTGGTYQRAFKELISGRRLQGPRGGTYQLTTIHHP